VGAGVCEATRLVKVTTGGVNEFGTAVWEGMGEGRSTGPGLGGRVGSALDILGRLQLLIPKNSSIKARQKIMIRRILSSSRYRLPRESADYSMIITHFSKNGALRFPLFGRNNFIVIIIQENVKIGWGLIISSAAAEQGK
jgi:hypothetical protein